MAGLSATTLEMSRSFTAEKDGGRNMEVAMAATLFRDLQKAGHIPAGAKLSDAPPASGAGLKGTSYEARLVELIADKDKNGKLDVDLESLRSSGILSKDATAGHLEKTLSGAPREKLSDEFIGAQSSKSGLSKYGVPDARGREVQGYSNRMSFTNGGDRAARDLVEGAPTRAAASPESAKKLADSAVLSAEVQAKTGNQKAAQDLLTGTGDALMKAGRYDDARRVFGELQKAPYRDTATNLVEKQREDQLSRTPDYQAGRHVISLRENGNDTQIKESGFKSTYGELAGKRLAQIDQAEAMSKTLGRTVDPTNVADAKAYFQKFSEGKSTDAVRGEYDRYLKNFYAHSGQGVTWDASVPADQRPAQVGRLFEKQPIDGAGRKIIDCEGYTYLTDTIFRDIQDAKGQPRFDVMHAGNPGHVVAGVFEKNGSGGFEVNNDATELFRGPSKTQAQRTNHMGNAIAGGTYNVVNVGSSPSACLATNDQGLPPLGAQIWVGDRSVGVVDEAFIRDFQQRGGPILKSLSTFVKERSERN